MLIAVALAAATSGVGALVLASGSGELAREAESTAKAKVQTVRVTRTDLADVATFDASVDYGQQWTLVTAVNGIVTWRPTIGSIIEPGNQLIRVADQPLFLVLGKMPMYRTISRVAGGSSEQLTGQDVQQLQEFLSAAGFDSSGDLRTDGVFDQQTELAIKEWQLKTGLPVTGVVDSSQIVFSPTAIRISAAPRVGQVFDGLTVTAATASLTIDVDNDERDLVTPGTAVEVHLSGGTTLAGRIDKLTPAGNGTDGSGADGSSMWRASITVKGKSVSTRKGVKVTVTKVYAARALVVPVGALLAPADGGFAVEVLDGTATRLVRVKIGDVAVDGMIDITGDLDEGEEVVIPK